MSAVSAAPRSRSAIERVLFVGLGGVGQRHLRNVRALLGSEVPIDAYRVRRERMLLDDQLRVVSGDVEERHRVTVFDDLERALARRPDVVFVTNPSSLHVPVALAAVRAGADVFIEKPLSHTLDDVVLLSEELDRRGAIGFVAYQLRRHPGFKRVRERLAEGAIGTPLSARAEVGEYLPGFHPYEDYRRMYAARRDLGGGVTLSQIHEIDLLYALFGMPRRVFSMGGKLSRLEVDVDDLSASVLEFEGPSGGPLIAELHQDFFQRPPSRTLRVVGDEGRLEWSLSEKTFTRWDPSGARVEFEDYADFPRNAAFLEELSYFFECVEQRRLPDVDVRAGAASLKVALALLDSQRTGRAIANEPEENTWR
ncbi:MAG TPA: Gfo/Idh/MocA family oxidoreductase [Polyangiaceae bacterium]